MTKIAVVGLILLSGFGLLVALFCLGPTPRYSPNPWGIAEQMVFWGTVSAAGSAAITDGHWNVKFTRSRRQRRVTPYWVWPLFVVILVGANVLVAFAVVIANSIFGPRRGLQP